MLKEKSVTKETLKEVFVEVAKEPVQARDISTPRLALTALRNDILAGEYETLDKPGTYQLHVAAWNACFAVGDICENAGVPQDGLPIARFIPIKPRGNSPGAHDAEQVFLPVFRVPYLTAMRTYKSFLVEIIDLALA